MGNFDEVWRRIRRHAGGTFHTITGLAFTYGVPGNYLRVTRDGNEVNRSLSKTNFRRAAEMMPSDGPGSFNGRQGPSCTWAILTDARIRD
ncbi:hypothetical protein EXU48_04240 [Occultella glacieicola]|uniref:NUMOD4 domain-containing protein n=1 Tax=Occultella glacieicola TaxID=2518684 RepID=A0ABY2E780_9MICO|nr:hypothetical protein [Occultella glacieicola]TDE97412.1 hypothetical protein EXU48_04240 [Occultella glacieicola]